MGRGPSLRSKQARVDRVRQTVQPRIDELDAEIEALLDIADKATAKGAYGPAVQARSRAATLRADRDRLESDVGIELAQDATERLRLMRRAATQEGSWTAASSLVREELELQARLEAMAAPPPIDPLDSASPQEVFEIIETIIPGLPLVQQVRLREVLSRAISSGGSG